MGSRRFAQFRPNLVKYKMIIFGLIIFFYASLVVGVSIWTMGTREWYWYAMVVAIIGITIASAWVAIYRLRVSRLNKIIKEKARIAKSKKEKEVEYFKKGAITREDYDKSIAEYEIRLVELEKEERMLRSKMRKKKLA